MDQPAFLDQKVVQGSLAHQEPALVAWFGGALEDARNVKILAVASPPAGSGFSAETYFIDVSWRAEGGAKESRFVLRRMSSGRVMFPGRDFGHERRVQEVVRGLDAAPVPRIIGYCDDTHLLGERFYVMSFIEGATPPTHPSYHQAGFLKEMPPPRRRALWLGALHDLGILHKRTHGKREIEVFARDGDGRSEFQHALDYWTAHYARASDGKPLQLMQDVEAWLRANEPLERKRAICWGDARIGNALFNPDGRCVGMFDWELFSLGDPTRDLAYSLYTDDHFVFAAGVCLDGWPSRDESISAYEEGAGFAVDRATLDFYRIFQGYHIVSTLSRLIQIKKHAGQMPHDIDIGPHFTPVSYLEQVWREIA